jgi:hypothetical protein
VDGGWTVAERAGALGVGGQQPTDLLRALPDYATEPSVQAAVTRYLTHVTAATERLSSWTDRTDPDPRAQALVAKSARNHGNRR